MFETPENLELILKTYQLYLFFVFTLHLIEFDKRVIFMNTIHS